MKRHLSWLVVFVSFGFGLIAPAVGAEGDLYQLGIALNQVGIRGGWAPIGKEGAWKAVRAGAILNERLYTAETDGTLRMTKLDSGERTRIGNPDFGETRFMFPGVNYLWTIENGGHLYRVDPNNGAWWPVGALGGWSAVRAGAILKGQLYTAETDSMLHMTDLATGGRKRLGKAEFGSTVSLLAAGESLWTIDSDGNLFRVDATNGARTRVGSEKHWQSLLGAAVVKDRLYGIHQDGTLHEATLPGGQRNQIGKPDFGNTTHLFAGSQQLYTIEADGTLYAVYLRPPESIDGWDCFPREFEKVFQEQAKGFHRNGYPRQILGDRATHAEIMNGLGWLREKATKQDMVVIYFTSHGGTDPKEGWAVETADGKTLWGHELKVELARLPCHALVFIETCGSGGFAFAHPKDPPVPANVTVLCACSGKQSASNELDIAVLEALWGRADFSRNGVVELDEMLRYVDGRYKEMYPAMQNRNQEVIRPVMVRSKNVTGSLPLTKVSPQLGAVVHDGALYSALVNQHAGDTYRVHILGYNNQPGPYYITSVATRDCICLPNEGPPLQVEQNGVWYPARLLSKNRDRYKVHYLGYNEEEVVTRNRIRYAFVGEAEAGKPTAK